MTTTIQLVDEQGRALDPKLIEEMFPASKTVQDDDEETESQEY